MSQATDVNGGDAQSRSIGLFEAWPADLEAISGAMTDVLGSSQDRMGELIHYLPSQPGKLLRPQLVMFVARRLGCSNDEWIDRARVSAACVELMHLGSLYHDDVMDEATVRRGIPTAHTTFSNSMAVLAGDIVFAASMELAGRLGDLEYRLMAATLGRLCRGQLIETMNVGQLNITEDEYFESIRGKTASLLGAASALACAQAQAGEAKTAEVTAAFEQLGLAFQMLDDLIDVIGPPGVSGKAPGQDLREGLVTLPLLVASQSDEQFRSLLSDILSTDLSPGKVEMCARAVIDSGAANEVLDRVWEMENLSRAALTEHLGASFAATLSERVLWTKVVAQTLDARQLGPLPRAKSEK